MEQRIRFVTLGVADVDPDGHPWEVALNEGFPLGDDGAVRGPTPPG